jgi:hypothetical protein
MKGSGLHTIFSKLALGRFVGPIRPAVGFREARRFGTTGHHS